MNTIKFSNQFVGEKFNTQSKELEIPAKNALKSVIGKTCKGSEWTGWWHYPRNKGNAELQKIKSSLSKINVDYDCVVVIGIGGSYLGTKAVDSALRNGTHKEIFYCGHHLSSKDTRLVLEKLNNKKPLVCVVSKSGTTTEPAVAFRVIRHWLAENCPKDHASRVIAITDNEKGALRELAQKNNWLSFGIPDDVGGRFSVLTPVGTVPLLLAGFDVERLMQGAHDEFAKIEESLSDSSRSHPAVSYAASRFAVWNGGKRIEIMSIVEPSLHYLCEWWKQLYGESEGKNHQGLFPASLTFTTDLHSLGQYAQDGFRSLIETFLTFSIDTNAALNIPHSDDDLDGLNYLAGKSFDDVNEAAKRATLLAHFDGEVPCMELSFPKLSEESLGQFFAFHETACSISALLLDVNPFDQPGVEDYKKNLFALMGKPGFESLSAEIKQRLNP